MMVSSAISLSGTISTAPPIMGMVFCMPVKIAPVELMLMASTTSLSEVPSVIAQNFSPVA